jgi:ABC-2 type transport system permease protein
MDNIMDNTMDDMMGKPKGLWRLLRIEWMKIRHYRTFRVLLAVGLLSLFALNFLAYNYYKGHLRGSADAIIAHSPFSFPEVWQTVSYISGFLLFIPGLLIITLITNEMSFRTLRQNIIDGLSRRDFIAIKLLLVLIISAVFTATVFLCGVFFGLLGGGKLAGGGIFIGYFYIQCVSYSLVALLFGLFIKRSGPAIGIFFVYIWVAERMLSGIMNLGGKPWLGNYLPLSTTDKLIPFPFSTGFAIQWAQIQVVPALLIMAAVYLLLYTRIAVRKMGQADL